MNSVETLTTQQLINAYYISYEVGLVNSVNLNGSKSSSISRDALVNICKNFPSGLLAEAKSISSNDAFLRYETARLSR